MASRSGNRVAELGGDLFDAMFVLADDPWDYALMPYEQRKQARLAAVIPPGLGSLWKWVARTVTTLPRWHGYIPEAR